MGPSLRTRLSKPSLWGIFTLVCVAYAVLPLLQWSQQHPHPNLKLLGSEFPAILLFYFAFIWLSPVPWQWGYQNRFFRPILLRTLVAFTSAEALITAIVFFDDLLGRWAGRPPTPLDIYLTNLCFQGPALFLVGNLMATREQLEEERLILKQKSEEAQYQHLKGQIHPHVLFNALNGLAEVLEEDPSRAEGCIRAMADFLHRILVASETALWPLRNERTLVEQFLVMETLRMGNQLSIRWDWNATIEGIPVLPMLLQPLVENAFKHGINLSNGGGDLVISCRTEGSELILQVCNTGAYSEPQREQGVGLRNLQSRLDLAYKGKASFELSRKDPWTTAWIRINLSSVTEANECYADNPGRR